MKNKKYDFSGYATKNDLKCSDGRTIRKDAFKENDGMTVPLVYQHLHSDPKNVLGHALLENREDGVYAYGKFNDSEPGKHAKLLVEHGDITALSILANNLVQKGANVMHGAIREVSLVLSGANPGALIDNVSIAHSDGTYEESEVEAVIYTGETISTEEIEHASKDDSKDDSNQNGSETVEEIFNSLNDKQKDVVYAMVAEAANNSDDIKHSELEGGSDGMKKNIFDSKEEVKDENTLSHSQIQTILEDAKKMGSLKDSFLAHAQDYGIENIDILFPDAKTVTPTPEVIGRRMEWVQGILNGTKHTPFSRIKSTAVDITAEEARARGYVKGSLKKEEVIKLLQRVTTPTTIYKKQKLDRDDIIDIVDLDVVSWLKAEMRLMLDEEIARAVLVGDGREPGTADKINEENIRPIYKDDDMYSHKVLFEAEDGATAEASTKALIETIIRARKNYKGSGTPNLYTTTDVLTDMLLVKDQVGRRLYNTEAELASALRVNRIIEVEVMEGISRTEEDELETVTVDLLGLVFNPRDYTIGADRGGKVSMFDDFDIDYNQYKYLIETRISGCLTKPKSALVIEEVTGREAI